MKRFPLLLLLSALALSACATQRPAITETGVMPPGGTIVVQNVQGDVNAFAPERGEPADEYTIAAYQPAGSNLTEIKKQHLVINVRATAPGVRYLVRGPEGGVLNLSTQKGSIMVADFDGIVNAHSDHGDVKMLIPKYGNVSVGTGNVSVIFASTDWPGTLQYTVQNGNVELYVNENAKAHVRLHTDDGNIYSDFNELKGSSTGNSETIDSAINGGGPRSIDVEVKTGSIRLMQLKPQV